MPKSRARRTRKKTTSSRRPQPLPPRLAMNAGDGKDWISDLPDDIITSILAILPLKEAVRTSLLCSRWRNLWHSLPHLDLDRSLGIGCPLNPSVVDPEQWLEAVAHILLSRSLPPDRSPIVSCTLYVFFDYFGPFLRSVVLFLCANGIRFLDVRSEASFRVFQVPGAVFSCPTLRDLRISKCTLAVPPPSLSCVSALLSLFLFDVSVADDALQRILSLCGSLRDLRLFNCDELGTVVIPSNIETLSLALYKPIRISLEDVRASRLVDLRIAFWIVLDQDDDFEDKGDSFVDILKAFSCVKCLKLHFSYAFGDYLEVEGFLVPPGLPSNNCLRDLRKLEIEIPLTVAILAKIILFMLHSSPNLESLTIQEEEFMYPIEGGEDYWEKGQMKCGMKCLSTVRLGLQDMYSKHAIGFARFFLLNASVLKKMIIRYPEDSRGKSQVEQSLRSVQWASQNVILDLSPYNSVEDSFQPNFRDAWLN